MTLEEMTKKGGKARWKGTIKKQRSALMRKVALARWSKTKRPG